MGRDFPSHGALAGDDFGIVERAYESRATFLGEALGRRLERGPAAVVQDDIGTVPAGRVLLDGGRRGWHEDGCGETEQPRG